jgi:hypothetical protein
LGLQELTEDCFSVHVVVANFSISNVVFLLAALTFCKIYFYLE